LQIFPNLPFFSRFFGTKYIPIPSPSVRSPIAVDHHFCHFCPLLGGTLPDPIFGPKTGNFGNFCKKLCFFCKQLQKFFVKVKIKSSTKKDQKRGMFKNGCFGGRVEGLKIDLFYKIFKSLWKKSPKFTKNGLFGTPSGPLFFDSF
jgi:hypothetical protein